MQTAPVNTTFAQPASVLVSPATLYGWVPLTFTIVPGAGGASATFSRGGTTYEAFTNAAGQAASPSFKANGIAGQFTIVATVGYGSPSIPAGSVTFTETN